MRIAAMILTPTVFAGLLALTGCKGPGSVQDAEAKVAEFHQRLDARDYEAIWRDSGPDIQGTDKAAFLGLLGAVHDQLGKVRESQKTGWHAEVDTSGSTAEVIMKTTFERGNRRETFVYKGTGEKQKLAGYHIEIE